MKRKAVKLDTDMRGSLAALKRAASEARKLAEATGTPLYVYRNGKTVNLNPTNKRGLKIA